MAAVAMLKKSHFYMQESAPLGKIVPDLIM